MTNAAPHAETLRHARDTARLSLREAARVAGVSPATLLAAERGVDARRSTLLACLGALPLSARALLLGTTGTAWSARDAWSAVDEATGWRAASVDRTAFVRASGRVDVTTRIRGLRLAARAPLGDAALRRLVDATWIGPTPDWSRELDLDRLRRGEPCVVLRATTRHSCRRRGELVDYEHQETLEAADAPTLPSFTAFGSAAHEGPACAVAVRAPTLRLRLIVDFERGSLPDDIAFRCWPALLAATAHECDLAPALGALPAIRREASRLTADIARPLPGFAHGLAWGAHVPRAAPPAGMPVSAPHDDDLGSVVRRARTLAGFGQRELAREMGVALHTLQAVELGRDVRASTLRALLAAIPSLRPEHLLPARSRDTTPLAETFRQLHGFEVDEIDTLIVGPGDTERSRAIVRSTALRGRARRLVTVTALQRLATRTVLPIGAVRVQRSASAEMLLRTTRDESGPATLVNRIPARSVARGMMTSRENVARRPPGSARVFFQLVRSPARRLRLVLVLAGPRLPRRVDAVMVSGCEPLARECGAPLSLVGGMEVALRRDERAHRITLEIRHPVPGFAYGLRWKD